MTANLAVNLVGKQYAKRCCNNTKPNQPYDVDSKGVPKNWGIEKDVLVVGKTCPLDVLDMDTGPVGERKINGC